MPSDVPIQINPDPPSVNTFTRFEGKPSLVDRCRKVTFWAKTCEGDSTESKIPSKINQFRTEKT
jgi:hypothetical protein